MDQLLLRFLYCNKVHSPFFIIQRTLRDTRADCRIGFQRGQDHIVNSTLDGGEDTQRERKNRLRKEVEDEHFPEILSGGTLGR